MCDNKIICPYCNKTIDMYDIMGDSDWDDQQFEWCDDITCPNPECDKSIKIRQTDIEITRYFEIEKDE